MKKLIFTLFFMGAFAVHAQFTIVPVKGMAGTPAESLRFPLVKSPKKKVAAKIDSLMQADILQNEIRKADPKIIFRNAVYISEPDSLSQSGHTAMDYEVLLNNARVLSIRYILESMGAHPEGYEQYYCFDAQTGNVLTEAELFTPDGLAYLTVFLRSEREKRIKAALKNDIPADDSAFARERYDECNSNANLGLFVIRKQDILFYREMCFPHAWRPYDTDLNVAIGFAAISKHLTVRGRRLLGL